MDKMQDTRVTHNGKTFASRKALANYLAKENRRATRLANGTTVVTTPVYFEKRGHSVKVTVAGLHKKRFQVT